MTYILVVQLVLPLGVEFFEGDARNRPFWFNVSTKIHASETFDESKKKQKARAAHSAQIHHSLFYLNFQINFSLFLFLLLQNVNFSL